MRKNTIEQIERHLKTHTERSDEDCSAVTTLKCFLTLGGRINDDFSCRDKWPNIDGIFELVPNPDVSRRPKQNFVVQIKGTNSVRITAEGIIKYQLKNLAFPAYVAREVTLDPCILFLVLNPNKRNQQRVFWKYISSSFIASIDFNNDSMIIDFTADDEIENTDESVNKFIKELDYIADNHSYIKQLESREYSKDDIIKSIVARCESICDAIKDGTMLHYTRDKLSKWILTYLNDLCEGTLILNAFNFYDSANLRVAWELALTNIETKFLSTFLQGLRYIGVKAPEDGQNERLMLKYYDFLWKIRNYLNETHGLSVLDNLEEFPRELNEEDEEYNKLIASSIEKVKNTRNPIKQNRYYVQKKVAFYVKSERYFEITLQLADKYATKYNRLTVYSKKDISSNYSIQVGCAEVDVNLWEKPSKIKVITNWKVSIEPQALNKLAKILKINTKLNSKYNEYISLMEFLTKSGLSLLDFIDFSDARFYELVSQIFEKTNTSYYKNVLVKLHALFNRHSALLGKNTIRYLLIRMREELLEEILPEDDSDALRNIDVYLSKKCYTFELNPILYNLPNHKTNGKTISRDVMRSVGLNNCVKYLPYIRMKHLIDSTGELYYSKSEIEYARKKQTVVEYNNILNDWDKKQGQEIVEEDGYVYLEEYVRDTVNIIKNLLELTSNGNDGQQQLNNNYIKNIKAIDVDNNKITALKSVFVDSSVLMIYGAAGTGKTTLMNYISDLMDGRSKLFLTKTHTALDNLKRRIKNSGYNSEFMGIDQFIKSTSSSDYDVIFVDECSTIDNRTMIKFLNKINDTSLLVFAGDIYQIESIDFGNWFFYSKEILPKKSIVELNSTWRTQQQTIKNLWEAVRFVKPLITEMLVIDGPFSENIGKNIFTKADDDEVVLCLNYDGKFGLNSINSYFQDANPSKEEFYWFEWKYKIGDPILFNDSKRFPMLYNNLKGTIVDIQSNTNALTFTIDIPILLTARDISGTDLTVVSRTDTSTYIKFSVFSNDEISDDEDYEEVRMKSIVPFQLAYAVSIHKAQGLEYNSIKIVIPHSNSERITHGIFYTAITRTKEKLKIFWSADTMKKVISSFSNTEKEKVSLDIIKRKLVAENEN